MQLGETDLTKIRIPIVILDDDGNLVADFVPGAHELKTSHTGTTLADAAGTLVQIGGAGSVAYYYQGTTADAATEGFTAVAINRTGYRGFAWRPVVGSAGLTTFPFYITSGGVLATGCNPTGTEIRMSLDGASFVAPTGTFGELGLGYYHYRHDVANVDTPVIIKINKTGFDLALAWGDAELAGSGGGGDGGGAPLFGPEASSAPADDVGDVRLTWSNATGDADVTLMGAPGQVPSDIASDRSLVTAVELSLFTDRRAEKDDVPPSGDASDRRGWWADQFAAVPGDKYGSRLWLLDRSKRTRENALRAKEYASEALAWMTEDKVVESVAIEVELEAFGMLIGGVLQRPGRDPVPFLFSRTWDHLQEDL